MPFTNPAPARISPTALLLCPHYPPSNEVGSRRVAAFARALQDSGVNSIVLTATYATESSVGSVPQDNIIVHHLPVLPRLLLPILVTMKRFLASLYRKRRSQSSDLNEQLTATGRVMPPSRKMVDKLVPWIEVLDRYKRWSWRAYKYATRVMHSDTDRYDIVIASGPPFSAAIAAILIGRKLGIPVMVDFRDPVVLQQVVGSWGEKFGLWICHRVQQFLLVRSDRITVTSPGIAGLLASFSASAREKVTVVRNGFDGTPRPRRYSSGHKLDIVFAGALYWNRSPDIFVAALKALVAGGCVRCDDISVRFFGAVPSSEWSKLGELVRQSECRVMFQVLPVVPSAELAPFLERATVVLNFAQGQTLQIPAKTFEHLGLGCEIVAICERSSDTGRLLDSIAGAHVVEPRDLAGLTNLLRDLYNRHVIDGVIDPPPLETVNKFSRSAQNDIFVSAVRETLATRLD